MKFVIVLKKLVSWLKRYVVFFLRPVCLLISLLCSEMTSTIDSLTIDELGGLPVGVARKISVEGEGDICRMPVRYL